MASKGSSMAIMPPGAISTFNKIIRRMARNDQRYQLQREISDSSQRMLNQSMWHLLPMILGVWFLTEAHPFDWVALWVVCTLLQMLRSVLRVLWMEDV